MFTNLNYQSFYWQPVPWLEAPTGRIGPQWTKLATGSGMKKSQRTKTATSPLRGKLLNSATFPTPATGV